MASKIVAVLNQKGGSGKTTVAVHIAAFMGDKGYRVLLADADLQGTAIRWIKSAKEDIRLPVEPLAVVDPRYTGPPVHERLAPLLADYDFIVIDGPPAVTDPAVEGALLLSDLLIIPTNPSPPDMWATAPMRDLAAKMGAINPDLKVRLLINNFDVRTALAREIRAILPSLGIETFETYLKYRTAYQQAPVYGTVVSRLGPIAREAATDIEFLCNEIETLIQMEQASYA